MLQIFSEYTFCNIVFFPYLSWIPHLVQ